VTLDCSACGKHLFTQGHNEALVCLNTACPRYGELQPDVDAGQRRVASEPDYDEDIEEQN
jgi:hypothetical protein